MTLEEELAIENARPFIIEFLGTRLSRKPRIGAMLTPDSTSDPRVYFVFDGERWQIWRERESFREAYSRIKTTGEWIDWCEHRFVGDPLGASARKVKA